MGKCVTDGVLCWMGPTMDQYSLVLQGVRSPMRGGWKENRPQLIWTLNWIDYFVKI